MTSTRSLPAGLIALALGGFGIGLTEFVIMGLLPEVARDFAVSEAAAGWLISGYALSVIAGALGLTVLTIRRPRKGVLAWLLILFILGNLISALAPTYTIMLLGRIVAALCHGAFFGIGSVVAANLVAPERRNFAVAVMFGGLTTANVLGVPLGTFLGQAAGWRSTFWAITVIGVIALLGVLALVPRSVNTGATPSLRRELSAFRSSQVWLTLGVTVFGFGGMFGAFTYIAYTLTEVSGFSVTAVPWLLIIFGLGQFLGNIGGGWAADRFGDRALIALFALLALVLVFFALSAASPWLTILSLLLMGGIGFGSVPGLQTRVMTSAPGAPTLASGANIAAFNLGNALGAWLGGLGIAAGLGYVSPLWLGAGLVLIALILMLPAARGAAAARAHAAEPPAARG